MTEDILFRRRNRLKNHFVSTSNVLLYCYEKLSDAAKVTFQVIDSFDWESKETHDSKGYVFPAVETIAKIRKAADRTIRRHILELIQAKLLTRIRRRNKPSILYIEEVSNVEADKYFALIGKTQSKQELPAEASRQTGEQGFHFQTKEELNAYIVQIHEGREKAQSTQKTGTTTQLRTDNNVRCEEAQERTKMSVAYRKKEDKKKENEINVNGNLPISETTKRSGMQGIRELLKQVEREKRAAPTNRQKKEKSEEIVKRDYLAQDIADALEDQKSLGAFRTIATFVPEWTLREYLAQIKALWKDGKVKSRGALFMSMVSHHCETKHIDLGFKTGATVKQTVFNK